MDKSSVLAHILKPEGSASFLGGELPARVVDQEKYISPLCTVEWETNKGVEYGSEGKPVSLDDMIQSALCDDVKTMTLTSPEGSGKTTALERLVVEWAKRKYLQKFSCVFLFRLKELNCLNALVSLQSLMLEHHGHITPETVALVVQQPEKVLLVFDDVHHCAESLDPSVQTLCSDPSQAVSLSCLVASLLHGSLLKGAAVILATRPTDCLDFLSSTAVTMLGFKKEQREGYFNMFFSDPTVAQKAVTHMEKTLSFYDFCSAPRFCWTVCKIYKSLMDAGRNLPDTLSQLFVEILVYLLGTVSLSEDSNRKLVLSLGKMAAHCYPEQHLSCSREEMNSFGLEQLSNEAGVFLQVHGDHADRFAFHSQLILDFLVAVSFYLDTAKCEGLMDMLRKQKPFAEFAGAFMSALAEPAQRRQLEALLGEFNCDQIADFKSWFKTRTLKTMRWEEHLYYLHLLHEAQNESLVKDIVRPSKTMGLSYGDMNLQQCTALKYVVVCLGGMQELILYSTNILTEELAESLAPVMTRAHEIQLSQSTLSACAVSHLALALTSGLTKSLDLSSSKLGDENFEILCTGLTSCGLQTLSLSGCCLTKKSCTNLALVLSSTSSQLSDLNLSFNDFGDQGLIELCKGLQNPHCKLQALTIDGCGLTGESMKALSQAVITGQSQLKRLDLTNNYNIGLSGVEALCKALQHPLCKLQNISLYRCELPSEICRPLMEALMSEHCLLSELNLSVSDLGQEGALLLCQAIKRPGCPMEKLGLARCELTQPVFKELGSLLSSGTSRLKSLCVGLNEVGDEGVKYLWDAVAHPNCLLENLDVEMTGLTDACIKDLCTAVRASRTLKYLELRNNLLTDASVPALIQVMQECPDMVELCLRYNEFSEDVFEMLEECGRINY